MPAAADFLDGRRIAGGNGARPDRTDDHAAGPDDAVLGDVGQDDRAVADPAVAADADALERPALLLDRQVEPAKSVLVPATQDVHVAAYRHLVLDRDPAE